MEKKLTPDEYAVAMNARAKALKELEDTEYETGEDHLLFKWGTLKSWKLNSEKGKELLKKYFEIGDSGSGMTQHDTPEQKALICEMIDECDGRLQSDWGGEYYTREEAKKYVMEYDSD